MQARWAFTADKHSLLADYQYNTHVFSCLNYFVSFSNGNILEQYHFPSTSHDGVTFYDKLILVSNNKHWLSKNAHTANTINETLDQPVQQCWSISFKNQTQSWVFIICMLHSDHKSRDQHVLMEQLSWFPKPAQHCTRYRLAPALKTISSMCHII